MRLAEGRALGGVRPQCAKLGISHLGWAGQMLYVHAEKKLAWWHSLPDPALTLPAAADLDSADALLDLGDAIAAQF